MIAPAESSFRPPKPAKSRRRLKAVRASLPALVPELTVSAALQCIGRACLDHLVRNEDAALAGKPESIHQMRVAVRRLRAMLSAFAPALPRHQRRWAAGRLEWFADALGDVRNLDVFTEELLEPARLELPAASEFERLALAVKARRRTDQAAAATEIVSARYTDAVLALSRWFDDCGWRKGAPAELLARPIAELAPALLDRCRDKAQRRARHFPRLSPAKRHRLRIALKKLRYAAEAFGELYDPAAVHAFIYRLKRLQDGLGKDQDLAAGHAIVAALAGPGRRHTGVGLAGRRVLAWNRRRIAEDAAQIELELTELFDTAPFWQAEPRLTQNAA